MEVECNFLGRHNCNLIIFRRWTNCRRQPSCVMSTVRISDLIQKNNLPQRNAPKAENFRLGQSLFCISWSPSRQCGHCCLIEQLLADPTNVPRKLVLRQALFICIWKETMKSRRSYNPNEFFRGFLKCFQTSVGEYPMATFVTASLSSLPYVMAVFCSPLNTPAVDLTYVP